MQMQATERSCLVIYYFQFSGSFLKAGNVMKDCKTIKEKKKSYKQRMLCEKLRSE